jgi:trehalose-phosphatase
MADSKTTGPGRNNGLPRAFDLDDHSIWQPVLAAQSVFVVFDFDGALVDLAPGPADVSLSEQRKRCLRDLISSPGCSVAVVSGRRVDALQRLVGLGEIYFVGQHGLEWTAPDGTRSFSPPGVLVVEAIQFLREKFRAGTAGVDGLFVEDRGVALALHYQEGPSAHTVRTRNEFIRTVQRYRYQGVELELLSGENVVEVKPVGARTGDAVARILRKYAPAAFPIYVGGDISDGSVFNAVEHKGLAISVAPSPRATAATFYLKEPTDVFAFVRCLIRIRGMPA